MLDRRHFLFAGAVGAALPPAIARAASIDAKVRSGTLADVEHVVILMQENRSFDHYFGAMNGVRGFADRFPIPLPDGRTVWTQSNAPGAGKPPLIAPFPLNTVQTFAHMRVQGTPHSWIDAQLAWDQGRMASWPVSKGEHAMGYYEAADIPFQYALADVFTICDAYHCSMQVGTNTNRLFLFTGTNDPSGKGGGPSLTNSHDSFPDKGGAKEPYRWTTYAERLQAAGVSWRVYQDMADNFGDNSLVGFASFRDSYAKVPGSDPHLAAEGLSTHNLDQLRADVAAGTLPQVSYVVGTAAGSEHPGPSSPAQGADYTAEVLDALTANPAVWAKTVFLVMFDENDGFFDHAPPPSPPSRAADGTWLGGSTVELTGEHHTVRNPVAGVTDRDDMVGRPYGLGPRVPMYIVSPWSRGGWVNSQVFDHTSVIRFLETRFGVAEPNISPWRRAVCGDLTSAFDFKTPNRNRPPKLPATAETAARAAALKKTTRPPTPALPKAPEQAAGVRPSRALPYRLDAWLTADPGRAHLRLTNGGDAGAVFHAYGLKALGAPPRRYTVGPRSDMGGAVPFEDDYDIWVLGPAGFHRHFRGGADSGLTVESALNGGPRKIELTVRNAGSSPVTVSAKANAYGHGPWTVQVAPGKTVRRAWALAASGGWYDLTVTRSDQPGWLRRLAGRVETGRDGVTDPAMYGPALMARE